MLCTLDSVFLMLPFSSKKQAQIIRHEKLENQVTDEEWRKRRYLITADSEHRLPAARHQLEFRRNIDEIQTKTRHSDKI
jgi:hypothetical protein